MGKVWKCVVVGCCAITAASVSYLASVHWSEKRESQARINAINQEIIIKASAAAREALRRNLNYCRDHVSRNARLQRTDSQLKELKYCATVVREFEPDNPILDRLPEGI